MYVFRTVKQGNTLSTQPLATYEKVSRAWEWQPDELERFPFGKLKGKWVGMTSAQLAQLAKG